MYSVDYKESLCTCRNTAERTLLTEMVAVAVWITTGGASTSMAFVPPSFTAAQRRSL